jgi:hypothetical protein
MNASCDMGHVTLCQEVFLLRSAAHSEGPGSWNQMCPHELTWGSAGLKLKLLTKSNQRDPVTAAFKTKVFFLRL